MKGLASRKGQSETHRTCHVAKFSETLRASKVSSSQARLLALMAISAIPLVYMP